MTESNVPDTHSVSRTDQSDDRAQSDADQILNTEKLDQLIMAAEDMEKSNNQLSAALVEYKAAARRHYLTLAILLILTTLGVVQNVEAYQGREQIKDCIEPGGQCYQRSVQRSANVVSKVNEHSAAAAAAAAACSQTFTGYVAVKACVDKALAK